MIARLRIDWIDGVWDAAKMQFPMSITIAHRKGRLRSCFAKLAINQYGSAQILTDSWLGDFFDVLLGGWIDVL